MGFFDWMVGRQAAESQRQVNGEQRFDTFEQKYQAALTAPNQQHEDTDDTSYLSVDTRAMRAAVGGDGTYTVKSGDDLSRIRGRYTDPYEYMRNFLRELPQSQRTR